ncbi:MAG TPA: hypothetical protein VFJ82_01530 [Longimicrobium sp.]|nr:hypothetical protein [Longimicrobium sp.]
MGLSRKGFLASLAGGAAAAGAGLAGGSGDGPHGAAQGADEECVRPARFGAAATGLADDSRALNAAIDAARKRGEFGTAAGEGRPVCIGPGVHRLDAPLNLVGRQHNLRGAGAFQTVLRASTGGVALDMAAAGFSTVRDLLLDTRGAARPSVVGILQARGPDKGVASHNHVYDSVVWLGHAPGANGGRGSVALYNVGAETTTYQNVALRGDVGLYLGSVNGYGLASPHLGRIGSDVSMTVVSVRGTSEIYGIAGPAVRINGGAQIDLGDAALTSDFRQAGLPRPYPYAIDVMTQVSGLRYSGSVEEYPGLMSVRSMMTGLFLECYAAHQPGKHLIFLAEGAVLAGGRIDVVPNPGTSGGNLIVAQANYGSLVEGMDITLYNQGIDLNSNGVLRGCTIRSTRTLAQTKAGIIARVKTGNVITATDGVHIDGVTPW